MKTMRTITLMITILILAGTGLMASCIPIDGLKGDGDVIKEERKVSGFTSLEVGGAFTVYLSQGSKETLTIEADKNLMEFIKTRVKGDRLEIYTDGRKINKFTKMNIYLTFKELEMMDFSGATKIIGEGMMQFGDLSLNVSGASEITLNMELGMLTADYSGASNVELSGKAKSVLFDCSGASQIDAYEFVAGHGELEASGASRVRVNVTDMLDAEVSGAASVKYKGSPKLTSEVSGAGSLRSY
ncbi:MAG: head GIN domain-containing protein [Bacteroidales bacterium]|nr:head GIN domain-containing protein [Bacteroidales bacterium]